ncbi:HD-GYP domain-containing protein [Paenibacillus sp. YIM B09110]|uniref:HD-GYP domain-containing protein n=1 Tax=Paenibacillus sp. YIM B09110 TaxID=3126102 RepID=UPI00301C8596
MKQLEMKSASAYNHCVRVALLAGQFASYLRLPEEDQSLLVQGCYLHDLGKLLTPSSILLHEGKLTDKEWSIMRLHPDCGGDLVKKLGIQIHPRVMNIIAHHHERLDGTGYPSRLSGDQIPYLTRICTVIDAFDSMMDNRCYRKGMPLSQAIANLLLHSGSQFDSSVVERFVQFTNDPAFASMMKKHKLSYAV